MALSILVVDSQPVYQWAVKEYLEHFDVSLKVFQAQDRNTTLDILRSEFIHLVLLDVKMPDLDGYTIFNQILKHFPATKVVINTNYDEELLVLSFIKLGVHGYILKNDQNLATAIEQVRNNQFYYTKTLQPVIMKAQREYNRIEPIRISNREVQLLRLMAKGLNSEQISQALCLTRYTVETYRKELLRRFRVSNAVQLVDWAHRCGFL